MNQPDRLIVRATIPSIDNPEAHILHATGTLPAETAPVNRSVETILHSIGHSALAEGYLSIDTQLERRNIAVPHSDEVVNIAEVLTKPIDRDQIILSDEYKWSDGKTTSVI